MHTMDGASASHGDQSITVTLCVTTSPHVPQLPRLKMHFRNVRCSSVVTLQETLCYS